MKRAAVGRVVHLFKRNLSRAEPEAAIITHVWGETMVNIAGWDSNGSPFNLTSVQLIGEHESPPSNMHAAWPALL